MLPVLGVRCGEKRDLEIPPNPEMLFSIFNKRYQLHLHTSFSLLLISEANPFLLPTKNGFYMLFVLSENNEE